MTVTHLPGRCATAEIETSAAPEQIWEALVDPDGIARWFVDRAEGRADRAGTIVRWFFDRFNYALPYRVLEATPGERLILDGGPDAPAPFVLEIAIRKTGGQTLVSLVNSGFLDRSDWDDRFEGVVSGWRMALATLKEYLERHPGRRRTQFFSLVPSWYEYEALAPYYREADLLAKWLTRSGAIGSRGEPCRLELRSGERVTGEVLERTAREVIVRWDEIGGALSLKAFSMGPGRRALCLHGSSWREPQACTGEVERQMTEALERLKRLIATE
jgi:uncharacterized protein YndB with AHSA1/START domain